MSNCESGNIMESINDISEKIAAVLHDCQSSIYLYGSCTLNDFQLGWSDIDIIVLTQKQISREQAEKLVALRQDMARQEPDNLYYSSVEGGMLSLSAFTSKQADRVVYWGTSDERITEAYNFNSLCLKELLESGVLLYGEDVRSQLKMPDFSQLYNDVKSHYEIIRKHAVNTSRSIYSFGWFLDIARGIYTLRTGEIISKTQAGKWALENSVCPVSEALETAIKVRSNPMK